MSDPEPIRNAAFDEYAEHYGAALNQGLHVSGEAPEYFARRRVEWLKSCLQNLQAHPRKVLDFGCGVGLSIPHLFAALGAEQVSGVDLSEQSLEVARSRNSDSRVRFSRLDIHAVSEPNDLVFCNGVFHHIPPDERGSIVEYIYRSLKPGGFFSLWENNPWNPGARWVMRRIPFDRGAIVISAARARDLLESAGFEIVRTDFQFIFPHFLRMFRGLESLLSRWPLGAQYQVLARKPENGKALSPQAVIVSNPFQWLHTNYVHKRRVHVLAKRLADLLPPNARVLDVGAGDGWLAQQIGLRRPDIHVEGIDILVRRDAYVPLRPYNGEVIPYPDKSFDAVLFVDVLHHTLNPAGLVQEALRTASQQVIIKDHDCEGSLDALTLRLMDRVGNQRYSVALPFNYMSRAQWVNLIDRVGGRVDSWNDRIGLYPLPAKWIFERGLHFIAVLKRKA